MNVVIGKGQDLGQGLEIQNFSGKGKENWEIGSIIKGTVVKGGQNPVVDFGGAKVSVISEALSNAKKGDELQLKVKSGKENQVILQIVDDYLTNQSAQGTGTTTTNTQVLKNTEQFAKMLTEYDPNVAIIGQTTEAVKNLGINITSQDVAKLRAMGIDISNGNVSHIIALIQDVHQRNEKEQNIQKSVVESETNVQNDVQAQQGNISNDAKVAMQVKSAEEVGDISDETLTYLMANEKPFTYENVYIAMHSHANMATGNNRNLSYSYASGQKNAINDSEWKQLEPQIKSMLLQQGVKAEESQMAAAKWILNHDQAVTPQNMQLYEQVQEWNEKGPDLEQYEKNVRDALIHGELLTTASLVGETVDARAKDLIEKINTISDAAVEKVISEEQPVILKNLFQAQDYFNARSESNGNHSQNNQNPSGQMTDSKEQKALKAKYELEKIRLQMTYEASRSLIGQNFQIETAPLNEIVEKLKAQQDSSVEAAMLATQQVEATGQATSVLKETMAILNAIPHLPLYSLGQTYQEAEENVGAVNLQMVYRNGIQMEQKMKAASQNYETMSTEVRTDLGDSMSKAFQNVDDILDDLKLTKTEENEKAVRILGYNQMEITVDNIRQISTLDRNLTSIVDALKPEIVMDFIKEGVNPVTMEFEKLQTEIEKKQEQMENASEEKYSEFLYKLDRKKEITPEQRASYIGIYRLLHAVTKFSDRELGAVVKNGQELTLSNLLSAYQSRKKAGMDINVDDSFGMLNEIKYHGTTINSQVEQAFENEELSYEKSLTKSVYEAVTPEGLFAAEEEQELMNLSFEYMEDILNNEKENQMQKSDVTQNGQPSLIEGTEEDSKTNEITQQDRLLYENMTKLQETDIDSVQKLFEYEIPVTPANIESMMQMMQTKNAFRQMKSQLGDAGLNEEEAEELLKEYQKKILDTDEISADSEIENISKGIEGNVENTVVETELVTQNPFINTVDEKIHEKDHIQSFDAVKLFAMQKIHTSFRVMHSMQQKETYLVPVNLEEGIVTLSVQLKKAEQEENAKVELTLPTDTYGTLSGTFYITENGVEGEVSSDNVEKFAQFSGCRQKLEEQYAKSHLKKEESSDEKVSKRQLFEVAKIFIETVEKKA